MLRVLFKGLNVFVYPAVLSVSNESIGQVEVGVGAGSALPGEPRTDVGGPVGLGVDGSLDL